MIQKLVKQDLVISAYKPNDNLEERFRLQAGRLKAPGLSSATISVNYRQ